MTRSTAVGVRVRRVRVAFCAMPNHSGAGNVLRRGAMGKKIGRRDVSPPDSVYELTVALERELRADPDRARALEAVRLLVEGIDPP
jgi:hypothetical protein